MHKSLYLYPLVLAVFGLGLYLALEQGSKLQAPPAAASPAQTAAAASGTPGLEPVAKADGLASAFLSLGLVLLFIAMMVLWIKPRLPRWIGHAVLDDGAPGKGVMAGVLVFLFGSALVTDVIGTRALFGAFLAGVVMPRRGEFREVLKERLEHLSSVFLLPLFFAFTGLRARKTPAINPI